jgi:hypothetical protein
MAALGTSDAVSYTYGTASGAVTVPAGYGVKQKEATVNWVYLSDHAGAGVSGGPVSWNGWHAGSLSNLYTCYTNCVTNPGAGGTSGSTITGLTPTLNGSAALEQNSNLWTPTSTAPWYRAPTDEIAPSGEVSVHYLSTPDTSGITFQFGHVTAGPGGAYNCTGCINRLAFYVGSLDPGNTVILYPFDYSATNRDSVTISGADLYDGGPGRNNYLTFAHIPDSFESYVVFLSSSTTWWQTVTFESCDYTYTAGASNPYAPNCGASRAAFEFDNLTWGNAGHACCHGPIPGPGPISAVPEPTELPALGTALLAALVWLGRRATAVK